MLVRSILREEQEKSKKEIRISKDALKKLHEYSYPGNVRELENILRRAIVFSKNFFIKDENIIFQKKEQKKEKYKSRISTKEIISALIKHRGNKSAVAKELQISRTHLYRILKNVLDENM